jgi:hypothetical protein
VSQLSLRSELLEDARAHRFTTFVKNLKKGGESSLRKIVLWHNVVETLPFYLDMTKSDPLKVGSKR